MVDRIDVITGWNALAEKLNLKMHEVANGDFFVKSAKGSWFIEIRNSSVMLWHRNFDGLTDQHRRFKKDYHFQKKLPDVEEALKYIKSHDRIRYTKYERTERIFEAIA